MLDFLALSLLFFSMLAILILGACSENLYYSDYSVAAIGYYDCADIWQEHCRN